MFPSRKKLRAMKFGTTIKTKDGSALRNMEEAVDYMLGMTEERQHARPWQHVLELLRDGAPTSDVTKQIMWALFREAKLTF